MYPGAWTQTSTLRVPLLERRNQEEEREGREELVATSSCTPVTVISPVSSRAVKGVIREEGGGPPTPPTAPPTAPSPCPPPSTGWSSTAPCSPTTSMSRSSPAVPATCPPSPPSHLHQQLCYFQITTERKLKVFWQVIMGPIAVGLRCSSWCRNSSSVKYKWFTCQKVC